MKRLLFAPIILVTSLVASLALGLELGDLVERDATSYEKFTNVPFTGEVTGLEQGGFLNGKREGLWVSYYRGGQLLWAGSFLNGKREGFFVRYWRDGTVDASWTGTWKNGEKVD
jgi:antitoxin component YwqK of YwqJK toxin-antitoxin module